MNVAIFEANDISQAVANIIEGNYTFDRKKTYNKVPLNVVTYVSGGGVLMLRQSATRRF